MTTRASRLLGLALLATAVLGAGPEPGARVARVELMDAVPTGPSVEERLEEIRRRIQAAVVYPPSARARGLQGVARVRFAIAHDGHTRGIELATTSGHWLLDRAATRSVREAEPLPWVYGRLEVPVRFALEF